MEREILALEDPNRTYGYIRPSEGPGGSGWRRGFGVGADGCRCCFPVKYQCCAFVEVSVDYAHVGVHQTSWLFVSSISILRLYWHECGSEPQSARSRILDFWRFPLPTKVRVYDVGYVRWSCPWFFHGVG